MGVLILSYTSLYLILLPLIAQVSEANDVHEGTERSSHQEESDCFERSGSQRRDVCEGTRCSPIHEYHSGEAPESTAFHEVLRIIETVEGYLVSTLLVLVQLRGLQRKVTI